MSHTGRSYLTPAAEAAFAKAMKNLTATFFNQPITINHKTTTLDKYGERPTVVNQPFNFLGIYDYTVGLGGRYHTVERSEIGQRLLDGWQVFLYKSEVDATGLVVDPEADSCTIEGKEYEIRQWTPDASFGTLPFQFYSFEVHYNNKG